MSVGLIRRVFKAGVRYYQLEGGRDFAGVTSILKFLPEPPALTRWKKTHGWDRTAAVRGTILHFRIANYYARKANYPPQPLELKDGDPKPDAEMGQAVSAMYSYFLEFDEKYKPEPLLIEQVVYHDELKYAGTTDFICLIDGEVWLLDWKSTGTFRPDMKPYESYNAQLSAYRDALLHMRKVDKIDRMGVVYISEEGYVLAESQGDDALFAEALRLYNERISESRQALLGN